MHLRFRRKEKRKEAAAKAVATKWDQRNEYHQRAGCTTVEPTKYEAVEVE